MTLLDTINEQNVNISLHEVEQPTHILLTLTSLKELKDQIKMLLLSDPEMAQSLGDEEDISIKDIEELLALKVCVSASNKGQNGFSFLKEVRTHSQQSR